MLRRAAKAWIASLAVHAAVAGAGLSQWARPAQRSSRSPVPVWVEFSLAAPAPEAASSPGADPRALDLAPRPSRNARVGAAARVLRHVGVPGAPEVVTPGTGTPGAEPATPHASTTITGLSAAELLAAPQGIGVLEGLAVPRGAGMGPAGRGVFDGSQHGSLHDIAMAPTTRALDGSQHGQAAGTMVHDRAVARRAQEAFDPVRTIPQLGALLRSAPEVSLPPLEYAPAAGERAAADELDQVHAGSFRMARFGPASTGSYHLLATEVEVDQSPSGALLAARIARPSGHTAFDREALRAIREALPEVTHLELGAGRRSRWRLEVSNAVGHAQEALLGGNEGWQVLSERSLGTRIRMRVRMVGAQRL